jgi:hypothetical protein
MDERLANILRRGSIAGGLGSGTVDVYTDGDPRLRLSAKQTLALAPVIRGESIGAIASQCRTSPNRVRRWLRSPVFRSAVAAEIARPTEARFRRSIILRGVQVANALRRERAAGEGTGADDEQD